MAKVKDLVYFANVRSVGRLDTAVILLNNYKDLRSERKISQISCLVPCHKKYIKHEHIIVTFETLFSYPWFEQITEKNT